MRRERGTAVIEYPCPNCGATANAFVAENGTRWSVGHRCTAQCGYMAEADSHGRITGDYREAVLRQSGSWRLLLTLTPTTRMAAMRVLRELLEMPLDHVRSAIARTPVIAWEGTRGEVTWIGEAFVRSGVPAEIRPSTSGGAAAP